MRSHVAEDIHTTILDWLRDYVAKPHPDIGRGGAVCPFALPALKDEAIEIRTRWLGIDPTQAEITAVIRDAVDSYDDVQWRNSNPMLRSLVIALPDLPDECLELLDAAHAAIKSYVVGRGLMIGQFHARCTEPAARNSSFMVSRSPVPLVAIRSMALHDILFLHEGREWFGEYATRFGHRYVADRAVDPAFAGAYARASENFGPQN
jgi:heptaprenyl diphosphate synthase